MAKFQAAGVAGATSDEDLRQFNRWLADPGSALEKYYGGKLANTLLKEKVFYFTLDSDFHDEEYAELFLGLAKHANPPLMISAISQSVSDDETCVVNYVLNGVENSFVTDKFYHPIEDRKVVQAFNGLLKSQGRRTMAFRFGSGRAEPYDAASYIVAEPELFVGLCMELGIPLHDYSGSRSEVGA